MLETIIFNFNDVVLLLIIFECILFAALLLFISEHKKISNILLAVFLLANALLSLDTLLYWSALINSMLSAVSPNWFFMLGFSFFLLGPSLYWYTKSLIYHDYALKPRDILHLLPALLYPLYMFMIYYRHNDDYKLQLLHDYEIVTANAWFEGLIWSQRLIVVVYGFLSLRQLIRYKQYLKQNYSNIEKIDLSWLQLLIIGFLTVWLWVVLILFESRFTDLNYSSPMSIAGNYFYLLLVNALVLYSLSQSGVLKGIQFEHTIRQFDTDDSLTPSYIEALKKVMAQDRAYLDPDITLEQLAARLNMPTRTLSSVINRHFQRNFFEFINYYRIEEAKKLLLQKPVQDYTIQEIMLQTGFKTKSAFNRFFKKFEGITPSEYRQRNLQSQ